VQDFVIGDSVVVLEYLRKRYPLAKQVLQLPTQEDAAAKKKIAPTIGISHTFRTGTADAFAAFGRGRRRFERPGSSYSTRIE
jgi:hypothetical protein